MAKKGKWGTLPWPKLLNRLAEKTNNRVVRTDEQHSGKVKGFDLTVDSLFYEVNS